MNIDPDLYREVADDLGTADGHRIISELEKVAKRMMYLHAEQTAERMKEQCLKQLKYIVDKYKMVAGSYVISFFPTRNHKLSREASNVAWENFISELEYNENISVDNHKLINELFWMS